MARPLLSAAPPPRPPSATRGAAAACAPGTACAPDAAGALACPSLRRAAPPPVRRLWLARALACATLAAPGWALRVQAQTPTEPPARRLARMTEGPFYPAAGWRAAQGRDWDADLTRVAAADPARRALGEHLALRLQVRDGAGRRVDGCEVEIWQCDALATYHHPRVAAERIDRGFQGFGAGRSDGEGRVAFRTIRPVPYPGRTPHVHVKLRHPAFGEVTSQLFVEGDAGNDRDGLWRSLPAEDRAVLALRLQPAAGADAADGLRWTAGHVLVAG